METNKLTHKDIDNIKKVLSISKTIYNKYEELYKLELNKKRNSKEYNDILNVIADYSLLEEEMYQKYFLSSDKMYLTIDYIGENILEDYSDIDDLSCILNNQNIIAKRVINILDKKIDVEECCYDNKMETDFQFEYNFILEQEILGYFLNNVDNVIKVEKSNNKKKKLSNLKYQISFLNKGVENIFLDTNFNSIDGYIYNVKGVNKELLKFYDVKYSYIYYAIQDYINWILETENNNSSNNTYSLLLYELYLDAIMKTSDKKDLKATMERLEETLIAEDDKIENENYKIIEKVYERNIKH